MLDSGIDDTLPDLQGQVDVAQRHVHRRRAQHRPEPGSHDAIGHGSHVAGIIGAKEATAEAWWASRRARRSPRSSSRDDGLVYPEAVVCGTLLGRDARLRPRQRQSVHGPLVLQLPRGPDAARHHHRRAARRLLRLRRGVTVIAAASNEAQRPESARPTSPSRATVDNSCKLLPVELDGVIGVSALAGDAKLAYYSNYGFGVVDFAAPGGDCLPADGPRCPSAATGQSSPPFRPTASTTSSRTSGTVAWAWTAPTGSTRTRRSRARCAETYALLQGTSQAAPHLTGIAALALASTARWSRSSCSRRSRRAPSRRPAPPTRAAKAPTSLQRLLRLRPRRRPRHRALSAATAGAQNTAAAPPEMPRSPSGIPSTNTSTLRAMRYDTPAPS